jgi:hypothetical protein
MDTFILGPALQQASALPSEPRCTLVDNYSDPTWVSSSISDPVTREELPSRPRAPGFRTPIDLAFSSCRIWACKYQKLLLKAVSNGRKQRWDETVINQIVVVPYPVLRIRIRDPVHFYPLNPGYGMGEKIKIRIRDEHPGSYFRELRNNFLGKIL